MPRETDLIHGMTAGDGVTIQVDEAIFDLLTRSKRPGETYNDVIRRLLGMPPKTAAADEPGTRLLPTPARDGATPGGPRPDSPGRSRTGYDCP